MEYPQLIVPKEGELYQNRNGCVYRCIRRIDTMTAIMIREPDGWTLTAHGIRQYRDGSIEWDYSTDGYWPDGKPKVILKEGKNEN